jgi:hypothetical protein
VDFVPTQGHFLHNIPKFAVLRRFRGPFFAQFRLDEKMQASPGTAMPGQGPGIDFTI